MTPRGQTQFSLRILPATGAVLALALGGCAASAESSPDASGGQPATQSTTASGQPPAGQEVDLGATGTAQQTSNDNNAVPGQRTAPDRDTTNGQNAAPRQDRTTGDQEDARQPQVQRCHTSMLAGELARVEPGAGQRYTELTLTNTSDQDCTLYGYGGMELVNSDGSVLRTSMERGGDPGPSLITLAPNESASSTLHWSLVPRGEEPADEQCQADPTHANVTPPDEEDTITVPWTGGPVCADGSIDTSAYHE